MPTPEEIKRGQQQNQDQKLNNDLLRENNDLLKQRLAISQQSLDDQRDFANLLNDQTKDITFQKQERTELLGIGRALNKIAQDSYSLDRDTLGLAKTTNDIRSRQAEIAKRIIQLKSLEGKIVGDTEEQTFRINKNITDQIAGAERLNRELAEQLELNEKIENAGSVKTFQGIADLVKDIPVLGKLGEPFEAAANAARGVEIKNDQIDSFKKLRKEGSTIKDALDETGLTTKDIAKGKQSSLVAAMNALLKVVAKLTLIAFVDGLLKADRLTGEIAKSMNMTYNDSLKMTQELTKQATSSGSVYVNTQGMQETLLSVNKALGTNVMLSEDMAVQFTEMREAAGFTNEELQGIANLSAATGLSMNEISGQFMAQAKLSAVQNGVRLNEKDLLKEIGQISAATTLSLGKNPALLGEAVAVAKSLGMELGKVEDIAGSLLDFESSIANELEAELLLNRDINLERARAAALNNEFATVAQEISEQVGSAADFANMNRLQQEAIAKAVGMSRESLAEQLLLQETLSGLTGDEAAEAEKLMQARIQQVGMEQAMAEFAQDGVEGLREQSSQTQKLGKLLDKLTDVFINLGTALLPIFEFISGIASVIAKIMQFLEPVMGIIGGAITGAAAGSVIPGVGTLAGAIIGGIGGGISDASRVEMAAGGIVKRPTKAIVGEAGPEAVTPLKQGKIPVDNKEVVKAINSLNETVFKTRLVGGPTYQITRNA